VGEEEWCKIWNEIHDNCKKMIKNEEEEEEEEDEKIGDKQMRKRQRRKN